MATNALMGDAQSDPINDPRIAFWSNPRFWPSDSPDHTFIARALLRLGQKNQGEDWSDKLPLTRLIWPIKGPLSIYTPTADIVRAVRLLREVSPEFSRRNPIRGLIGGIGEPEFPKLDEWKIALSESQKQSDESWQQFLKFTSEAERLADACRRSIVKSATRGLRGGDVEERPWHFWNMEFIWTRFDTCRVQEEDNFKVATVSGTGLWLYVETSSFEKYLEGGSSAQSATIEASPTVVEIQQAHRRSGRPAQYHWDEIMSEFTRILHTEGIPTNLSAIARRLADWAAERQDHVPDEKTIAAKVRVWLSLTPIDA